jgi:hypothetical protein
MEPDNAPVWAEIEELSEMDALVRVVGGGWF